VKVLLFEEELDDELVEAGVEVPVELAEVVSRDVVAKIGELYALAFALAAALAFHSAAKDFAGNQFEPLELREQVGREEIGRRRDCGHSKVES
jgi:hypothetical protein